MATEQGHHRWQAMTATATGLSPNDPEQHYDIFSLERKPSPGVALAPDGGPARHAHQVASSGRAAPLALDVAARTASDSGECTATHRELVQRPLVRRFHVHVGRCRACQRRVQGRHPLQTSDALGAAAVQLGPQAVALAVVLALEAEIASIKRAFPGLGGVRKGRPAAPERAVPKRQRRRRRRLSADVRARLSKLAKARWAKAKKAGKKRL